MRVLLVLLGLVAVAGTAAACEGLSPGDQMSTDAGLCTLAFIVASPTDLYFATAGHCIQVDQIASNPDYGEIGRGAFHFLEPETGGTDDGSPGYDFGLIRIDPELYPDLNPKMCGWDGPVGIYEGGGEGGMVRHYGHGLVFGDLGPTTQQRQGFFLTSDEEAFYWSGMGVMGDSGSGVLDENNMALGVLTHVLVGVNGIPPADNGGTRLQRGFELAAEEGFTDLRLVLAGEDPVAVMREMADTPDTPDEPTSGTPPTVPTTKPGTSPTKPVPSSPPASNETGTSENDSIDPASSDDDGAVPAATKDTPFPAGAVLALAVAVAVALPRARRRER